MSAQSTPPQSQPPQRSRKGTDGYERLAKGLGWFSLGLGAAELFAAGPMARFIGVRNSGGNRTRLRAYGMREIGAGVGILSRQRPQGWLWARVAGDIVDIGSLASGVSSPGSNGARIAGSILAVAGVTALDLYCASQMSRLPGNITRDDHSRRASHSAIITINRPADELQRRLRDFIRMRGEGGDSRVFTSGVQVSDIQSGAPGTQGLRWRAQPATGIAVTGAIRFEPAPADRGTIVRAELESPWNSGVARVAGKLFKFAGGELLQEELRQFKQLVETGEIAVSDATMGSGVMHEAQPPRELVHA